jgi:hypothetical protein
VRSSGRIPKELPILLIGSDLDGRVFSEHTSTVLLSLHGAGIISRHKLSPDQELILRLSDLNRETEIRVVGQIGAQYDSYTYGVAFLDPNLNFWEVDFPPISTIERELGLISLICNSCKTIEKIDDTSIEADVCATNESVLRFCKHCSNSTLWKPAPNGANHESIPAGSTQLPLFSPGVTPAPAQIPVPPQNSAPVPSRVVPPEPPPSTPSFYAQSYRPEPVASPSPSASPSKSTAVLTMPPPENPSAPRVNRRKHPRVRVNYSACVRHPDRGDDIVACEDMSKGGLRFKSKKQYYAQSLIEVAVPYEPGQPAIFVPAQIVFVEELPEQRFFRYGVAYLQLQKPRLAF